jgi:hypothetical protein
MGEKQNAYRILVGKPEGNRQLGGPRHRCLDNIKMDLRDVGCDGMDCIDLVQDRDQWRALVNSVLNLQFHKMLGSSRVGAQLAVSQEGFSFIKLFSRSVVRSVNWLVT